MCISNQIETNIRIGLTLFARWQSSRNMHFANSQPQSSKTPTLIIPSCRGVFYLNAQSAEAPPLYPAGSGAEPQPTYHISFIENFRLCGITTVAMAIHVWHDCHGKWRYLALVKDTQINRLKNNSTELIICHYLFIYSFINQLCFT